MNSRCLTGSVILNGDLLFSISRFPQDSVKSFHASRGEESIYLVNSVLLGWVDIHLTLPRGKREIERASAEKK
jgi:hypothetical protein